MSKVLEEMIRQAELATRNELAQPVILKEMLHYEILSALSDSDMGERLVFQGGTALRACYAGTRLSEDLDFVCGAGSPEPLVIDGVREVLRTSMVNRYGLDFDAVSGPSAVLGDGVGVKRWTFKIRVPWESKTQNINFEVCNVPSLDAVPKVIRSPYASQQALQGIVLHVESREEIYADKLVALALRKHLKARDVWDLSFLSEAGVKPNYEWVAQKVAHYDRTDAEFMEGIEASRARMLAPDACEKFAAEMARFLDVKFARIFQSQPGTSERYLRHALSELDQMQAAYSALACQRDAEAAQELSGPSM